MSELATYIAFPGNAREAFEHYADVFGADLELLTYGQSPMEGMPFEPDPNMVAHAVLRMPGGTIAGGDAFEDVPLRDTAYSLLYTVQSNDLAVAIIDKFLAGGGSMQMPFEQAPWGDYYGQVFDKFGVMWALSVEAERD